MKHIVGGRSWEIGEHKILELIEGNAFLLTFK